LTKRIKFVTLIQDGHTSIMANVIEKLKEKYLLFKVINQKDSKAFGELFNLYRDRIYRFIFFKVKGADDAADIANDVFLKVWKFISASSRSPEGRQNEGKITNLQAFLYSTARNTISDYFRGQGITVKIDDFENSDIVPDTHNAQTTLDIKLDSNRLLEHLKLLKDEYREVLVMRYLDEMEYGEIAEALGKNEGNVRVLLHRATQALKSRAEGLNA